MSKVGMTALIVLVVIAALVASACSGGGGGGGEQSITGLVTKVDTGAKTFSVNASSKDYDFKMAAGSKGDINEIKEHLDAKKQIEVRYKSAGNPPYEVVNAD